VAKKTTEIGTVFPTGERDMPGVPSIPLACDAATAARLVASGAFRYEAPEIPDGETPEITVTELSEAARAALDLFVPAEPGG